MAGADLVEREEELGNLIAIMDEALQGQGRVALIEGPAGIGKTRLLTEVRSRAEAEGVRVMSARGSDLEREFAFGVVRQLFEPALGGEEARERAFAGAAAPARAIFGSLEEGSGTEGDTSFAALHSLFWLLLNIAGERPLVLSLDDLHWCDRPSLRFVAYLVHRLEDLPILLATTLRTAEPGTDTALLGEIAADPATVPVRPRPLGEAAVRELVQGRLGDADERFSAACLSVTRGNPLFLRQLLTSLNSEGVTPDAEHAATVRSIGARAVSRTVLLRLARLSSDAIAVAQAVAILGEGAELRTVAALSELDERQVADATVALARAEILRPETPLGFVHPLVRDAVYHDLSPVERELRHTAAARKLQELGASSEQVAAQLLWVPPRGEAWVSSLLRTAGHAALAKGAPESGVAYLQRALDEPPPAEKRPQLLFELGAAETHTAGPDAARHLEEAFETLEDPALRGMAGFVLARTLLFIGEPNRGLEIGRRAAASLPDDADLSDLRYALEAIQAMTVSFGASDREPVQRLLRYRDGVDGRGPGARMLMTVTAWWWTVEGGPCTGAVPLARRALEGGVHIPADPGLFWVVAIIVLVLADEPDAVAAWDEGLEGAHRQGSSFGLLSVYLWRGYALMRRGELEEAEESLREALSEMESWGSVTQLFSYPLAVLGETLIERGDYEEAHRILDPRRAPPLEVADGTRYWVCARAELFLRENRTEEALRLLEEHMESLDLMQNPASVLWRSQKARALERLGRHDEAVAEAELELAAARQWGAPRAIAGSLRVLAEVDADRRLELLTEAVEVAEASPAKLELAKCLAALGTTLRLAREPSEAREPLRRALELAEACGAVPLSEQIRAELHAAGVRPRTAAMSGVQSLTASERRVATLAAEGQTNRDIAQTLYVTPKTVEVHLTGAYRKLGIRSRRELPRALEQAAA